MLASGSAQDFYSARELKKELKNDTCMLKGALEHLFHYQVEADTRVRHLLLRQTDYKALTDERICFLCLRGKEMNANLTTIDRKVQKLMRYQKNPKGYLSGERRPKLSSVCRWYQSVCAKRRCICFVGGSRRRIRR